jgi:hypothetical protein
MGDGTTDDTAAVQRTLDEAAAVVTGIRDYDVIEYRRGFRERYFGEIVGRKGRIVISKAKKTAAIPKPKTNTHRIFQDEDTNGLRELRPHILADEEEDL